MSQGWECPKCQHCYPIWVSECKNCKQEAARLAEKSKPTQDYTVQRLQKRVPDVD